MGTNKFDESIKHFQNLTKGKKRSCMWQEFPKDKNFYLECWLMQNDTISIFQIFAHGKGFIEYVEKQ